MIKNVVLFWTDFHNNSISCSKNWNNCINNFCLLWKIAGDICNTKMFDKILINKASRSLNEFLDWLCAAKFFFSIFSYFLLRKDWRVANVLFFIDKITDIFDFEVQLSLEFVLFQNLVIYKEFFEKWMFLVFFLVEIAIFSSYKWYMD